MSERAFDKLLLMLYPKLLKNIVISSNSTSGLGEIISPEMTMAIGLHPLVGASYIDLTELYSLVAWDRASKGAYQMLFLTFGSFIEIFLQDRKSVV